MLTDLTSHRIEGYLPGGAVLDIPLISHVKGNLYQGGCLDGVSLPEGIEYVVSLYPWERYFIEPGTTKRLEFALYDWGSVPSEDDLDLLADIVNQFVAMGPTLVHCQAGINRSALVAGYYLITWAGMEPKDAIALLREQRSPLVLANKAFEEFLLNVVA